MSSPAPFKLTTPLPAADLRFESMSHASGLSVLDEMQLNLLSDKPDLQPEALLGHPVDLAVQLRDGAERHFCGLVTRFGIGRHQGRYFGYQATVRPWLWFLTRTADCRVFQAQTVPEIVATVFNDHAAIANHKFNLQRSYRKRVYCVQYRETDFNFVARLLEDEGIYWYFEHSAGQHQLMLVDAPSAHKPMPGNPKLPYHDNDGAPPPDVEWLSNWQFARSVKPGKCALTSYDFERPATRLKVDQSLPRSHPLSDLEMFDFQGDYIQKPDGQQLADDHLDEQQCRYEQLSARSNAHALATGQLFQLTKHPRADQNGEYLCVQLEVSASEQASESGGGAGHLDCSLAAMASAQTFRPQRRTPKPFVQGPQTAVVVGPAGEEIYTDKYGRVKVQFHWDRYGTHNERSSLWVRVSSPWAGKSFGFVQVPRIGQEVVVDFLEGDPDQPLITGRVYNADQMPPWELPANATQSGVLTRSSKTGAYGNANALRFEDKKGAEQLWLHAEKNQDIEVENDETHWVGHDRSKTIDRDETTHVKHDRAETVDNDETITVHHDRSERVDHDESISIGHDRHMLVERDKYEQVWRNKAIQVVGTHSESIGGAMNISVGSTLTETVAINYAETVGAAMELTVGGALAITVGAVMSEAVAGAKVESIGAGKSESIGGTRSLTVGGNSSEALNSARTITIAKEDKVSVGEKATLSVTKEYVVNAKKIQLVGEDEINFKCGSAEITLKKNGDVVVKGDKISIKASGDLVLKGSKIAEN